MGSRVQWLRQFALQAVLTTLPVVAVGGLVQATAVDAQRGPVARTVAGKVTDKSNAPLQGAVVYLKDDKTLSVKSFIATDQGTFRFGQLSQNTDYEVWAEASGKKSGTKTISSFDSKADVSVTLKIDTNK